MPGYIGTIILGVILAGIAYNHYSTTYLQKREQGRNRVDSWFSLD